LNREYPAGVSNKSSIFVGGGLLLREKKVQQRSLLASRREEGKKYENPKYFLFVVMSKKIEHDIVIFIGAHAACSTTAGE